VGQSIKPVIKNGEVITAEIGSTSLALKKPIPLSEFSDFVKKLEAIAEYIDFAGNSGWNDEELEVFLLWEISDRAHDFFKILSKQKEWTNRKKILKTMKITPSSLAGTLSSPGQYFTRWKKDPVYEKDWKRVENKEELLHYRIKPKYFDMIKKLLKEA